MVGKKSQMLAVVHCGVDPGPKPIRHMQDRMAIRVFALCILAFLLARPLPADAQTDAPQVGTPWTGSAALRETTTHIMVRQGQQPARIHPMKPQFKLDFQTMLANPQAPNVSSWPPAAAGSTATVTTGNPQTIGLSFTAASLAESAFPPDTMGVAGPSQFIIALNNRIRSFNKATGAADGVLDVDTDIFFQSVMTSPVSDNFTSDPRIRYDRLSGRWFITIIDVPGRLGSLPNRILIAVSDGSTITAATVWSYFFFRHDIVSPAGDSGNFADYPTLGVDANALYIGVNVFRSRGQGTFSSTTGFVIRKSSILGPGPIVVTAFRGLVSKVQGVLTGLYTPH